MSRCRACDAPIIWARTAAGKSMPLDAVPVDGGNVEVNQNGGRPLAFVHHQPPLDAGPLYMPHHATCPNADEFRR